MEEWLTRRLNKATAEGAAKAAAEANEKAKSRAAETLVDNVDSLMKNEGFSMERACRALNSTVAKYEAAKKLLAETAAVV